MIAKVMLITTDSASHPMAQRSLNGYIKDLPHVGHPLVVWYADGYESKFLRTSSIASVDHRENSYVVRTANSVYRLDLMDQEVTTEN